MHSTLLAGLVALAVPLAVEGASCSGAWQQCGGVNYNGPTCCVDGYTCILNDQYYSQCRPGSAPTTTTPPPQPATTTPAPVPKTTTPAPVPATTTPAPVPSTPTSGAYLSYDTEVIPQHSAAPFPADAKCPTAPMADCMSGTNWGEMKTVTSDEKWHYSRSTHYGLTTAGACGFGMYGLCTKGSKTANWTDAWLGSTCDAFCKAYPALCQDPKDITLRGNFAAPEGKYYTQFWSDLAGNRDNYLSCGECFELVHTKKDGTDYQPGEAGYTDPIVLEVTDSCPCDCNTKWCCGSGDDQCQEISDFKYGCPIPKDSTHLDLSDIAMGRLLGNGAQDGVIPTRYKRVPCPKPGNIYIWMQQAGPYYFGISIVNTAGVGSVTKVEIKGAGQTKWTKMLQNPDFPEIHPQNRYGTWTIPRDTGPFNVPIGIRVTSPNGEQVTNENVITSFTPPASAPSGFWYLDLGGQFTMDGKH